MSKTEHKSKIYFLILIGFALLIYLLFRVKYQPILIEASCSEIASFSSNLLGDRYSLDENEFSYNSIKNDCLKETLSKK